MVLINEQLLTMLGHEFETTRWDKPNMLKPNRLCKCGHVLVLNVDLHRLAGPSRARVCPMSGMGSFARLGFFPSSDSEGSARDWAPRRFLQHRIKVNSTAFWHSLGFQLGRWDRATLSGLGGSDGIRHLTVLSSPNSLPCRDSRPPGSLTARLLNPWKGKRRRWFAKSGSSFDRWTEWMDREHRLIHEPSAPVRR